MFLYLLPQLLKNKQKKPECFIRKIGYYRVSNFAMFIPLNAIDCFYLHLFRTRKEKRNILASSY